MNAPTNMFGKHRKTTVNLLQAMPIGAAAGRQRRRRVVLKMLITAVLTLAAVGLVALPFVLAGVNAYRHALSGQASIEAAQQSVAALDLKSAEQQSQAAVTSFGLSRAEIDKLNFLVPFPWIGQRLAAADRLLAAGQASSQAVTEAVGVARQVLDAIGGGGVPVPGQLIPPGGLTAMTPEKKHQVLMTLSQSGPQMRDALVKIEEALTALDNLPDDAFIAPYKDKLADARIRLETAGNAIAAALPAVESLPQALGYPQAQRYLVFFQNNTEMRPTGGFLGLVGQATVQDADLQSIDIGDTYALDAPSETVTRVPAPAPIQKYVKVSQWYLRDANWSPDFTVSAQRMEQFYREEAAVRDGVSPAPFDGVIAVTPNLAEDVLRLTGPLTVEGEQFTADNLVDKLEFEVEKAFAEKGIARSERKAIVGSLAKAVFDKTVKFSLPQLLTLVNVVQRDLAQGHVLLFARDPTLEGLILDHDWGGKLQEPSGDYLSVIDANLASLKTDPEVSRDISYSVKPDGLGGFEGRVAVTYANHGSFTWKTTRYRTYTRLFLPRGSQLLGVTGAMDNDKLNNPAGKPGTADSGEESNKAWFGAFISIEPGETKTLEFRFRLARLIQAGLLSNQYTLTFEKQPGTPGYGLTLDLDFGKKLTSAEPPEKPEDFGNTRYQTKTDLTLDRYFKVYFRNE